MTNAEPPKHLHHKRPIGVWIITIVYGISLFANLLGGNQEYFESKSIPETLFIIYEVILSMVGVALLFYLKKAAFYLLLTAYITGALHSIYAFFFTDYLDRLGIGWGMIIWVCIFCLIFQIAILFYVWSLVKKGILS